MYHVELCSHINLRILTTMLKRQRNPQGYSRERWMAVEKIIGNGTKLSVETLPLSVNVCARVTSSGGI